MSTITLVRLGRMPHPADIDLGLQPLKSLRSAVDVCRTQFDLDSITYGAAAPLPFSRMYTLQA